MIILHATAAVVALAVGTALLSLRRAQRYHWLMPVFLAALVGMIIGMVGATTSHWSAITAAERVIFSALAILALFTLYLAWRARRVLGQPGSSKAYSNYIGFSWIVLLEGLIILAPLDLGAPAWVTAIVAIVTLVVGIRIVGAAKQSTA